MENFSDDFFALGDAEKSLSMKAYMKDHFPFVGLYAKDRKQVQSQHFKTWKPNSFQELERVVQLLWDKNEREFQYAGIELLLAKHRVWSPEIVPLIKRLVCTKSWWDTVDLLAASVLCKALDKFAIPYQLVVEDYLEAKNKWLHRSAIIVQLKRKQNTDLDLLIDAIQTVQGNGDFFIQKAIGWSLREVSKWNPIWVMEQVELLQLEGLAKREALKKIQ
jgi:3-methyladenine DNA glycosylase AlkD